MAVHVPDWPEFRRQVVDILSPELGFFRVVIIYSLAIGLLTLAVPLSVQLLVDTVANVALVRAVLLISLLLFSLLFLSGVMYALRAYTMELFARRVYARVSSEIAMTAMLAEPDYFGFHQRSDLINRYFDILTLKKSIPFVLTNGFTLILQSIIGFTIVSFYHFYFLIFSIVLILLLWLVWRIWGWPAIETSIELSEAKYQTASWLQSLAYNNESYRSSYKPAFGLQRADDLIEEHIDRQVSHFRNTFAQLLSFLFLSAAASAILLGMGGWLVIRGELTLGQLVAAELIMSAIFMALPQMGTYLGYLYDICAGVEELARFRDVATEAPDKDSDVRMPDDHSIVFNNVQVERFNQEILINLEIPPGGIYRVSGSAMCLQRFTELLLRNTVPEAGVVTIGGYDIDEIRRLELRRSIRLINRVTIPPLSIRDFMSLYERPEGRYSRQQALAMVGLDDEIAQLVDGIDTLLSRGGWPLSQPQVIRLKLATVLLSVPAILILEDIVDVVEVEVMEKLLDAISALGTTVLYFSSRGDLKKFDRRLQLDTREQKILPLPESEHREQ